jgi:hypothetical protein
MPDLSLEDLETQLAELASRLVWPPEPDLAQSVGAHLRTGRPPGGRLATAPRPGRRRRVRVVVAAAVVVAVFVSALGAWPGGRRAVAELLGLRSVHISTGSLPPVPTSSPQSPTHIDLGRPVTLADAGRRVRFPIRIPTAAGFGHPDGVFFDTPPPEGEVTLMYLPRPDLPVSAQTGVGLLLTEFNGTMEAGFFAKVAGPDTTIEALSVHNQAAYWLAGAPHAFFYRLGNGDVYGDTLRLAANTLVWQSGPVTLRVEGDITKAQALAIANSLP